MTQAVGYRRLTAEVQILIAGQSVWYLWWRKCHWDWFLRVGLLLFLPVSIVPPKLHTHSLYH